MRKLIFALLLLPVLSFAQGTTTQIRHGASLPSACSPSNGDVFFKTGTASGLYDCPSTNTWRLIATASSGSPGGSNTHVQVNDSGAFYGDSCFTYDKSTHVVSLGGCGSSRGLVTIKGAAGASSAPGGSNNATIYHNTTTGKLGCIDSSSADCWPSGGTPGGSDKQIQYNNAGAFGGISNGTSGYVLTSNGSGSVPSFQAATGGSAVATQSDVTASRAAATTYQNTGSSPLFITVTFYNNTTGDVSAVSDSSSTPTTLVARNTTGFSYSSFHFIVLPGNYYKVSSTATLTIIAWIEWH